MYTSQNKTIKLLKLVKLAFGTEKLTSPSEKTESHGCCDDDVTVDEIAAIWVCRFVLPKNRTDKIISVA